MDEDDLLDEFPPGYDCGESKAPFVELYACPIGVALWNEYRAAHPDAPEIPPECSEEMPAAGEYWIHASVCLDCNEV